MATIVSGTAGPANSYIDALIAGGNHWSGTITYSFHNSGAKAWSDVEKYAFRSALDAWASVADIRFQELADNDDSANLREFLTFESESVLGSHQSPFNETDGTLNGYFNYNGVGWDYETQAGGLRPGGFGYLTLLQEIGRALGLANPHDNVGNSGVFPGVTPGDASDSGDFNLNSDVFTVMSDVHGLHSKTVNGNFGEDNNGYALGPMAFDVAAIQRLYGAVAHNGGDNVYTVPNPNHPYFMTIWDTGGIDTIVGAYDDGSTVDLRDATLQAETGGGGFFSAKAPNTKYGAFTIAPGVVIENATGGFGADTLIGNAYDNVLTGGREDDTLWGGNGADTLIGGSDNDTLVYMNPGEGGDKVIGFESGGDKFQISQSGFGLTGTGTLAASGATFENGTDASGASRTFLYDKPTGHLVFDSNGSGAGGKTLLATLITEPDSTAVDASWGVEATGDFDGDGDSDILWRNANGETRLWQMNNNAKAQGQGLPVIDSSWKIGGAGDFDNDGTDDILWHNSASGELVAWQMQNGQKSEGFLLGTVDPSWSVQAVADFNGDGTDDVLYRNTVTNEALVWTVNNNAKTEGYGLGEIDSVWKIAGNGDFDNDGTADIAFRNSATGELLLWQMQNGQKTDGHLLGAADSVWNVVSLGDTNTDGTADVIWRNSQTGELLTWGVNNFQKTTGSLSGIVDTKWRAAETGDFNANNVAGLLWRDTSGAIVAADYNGWNQANLAGSDFVVM